MARKAPNMIEQQKQLKTMEMSMVSMDIHSHRMTNILEEEKHQSLPAGSPSASSRSSV